MNGESFFKIRFGLLRRAAQGAGAAILGGVFKKPRFVPVFAPEAFGCGKIGFAVRAAAGAGIERDGEQRCAAGIDFKCKITHAQSVEIIAEHLKAVDEVVEIADSAGDVVVFIRNGIRKAAHERGAAVPWRNTATRSIPASASAAEQICSVFGAIVLTGVSMWLCTSFYMG